MPINYLSSLFCLCKSLFRGFLELKHINYAIYGPHLLNPIALLMFVKTTVLSSTLQLESAEKIKKRVKFKSMNKCLRIWGPWGVGLMCSSEHLLLPSRFKSCCPWQCQPPMNPLCRHYGHLQKGYQMGMGQGENPISPSGPWVVIHAVDIRLEIFMVHIK